MTAAAAMLRAISWQRVYKTSVHGISIRLAKWVRVTQAAALLVALGATPALLADDSE